MANSPKVSGIFIVSNGQGLTRIACTKNLRKQWDKWQADSAAELNLVGMITQDHTREATALWLKANGVQLGQSDLSSPMTSLARSLRQNFARRRVQGEWFALDDATFRSLPIEFPEWNISSDSLACGVPTVRQFEEYDSLAHSAVCQPEKYRYLSHSAPTVWTALCHARQAILDQGHSADQLVWEGAAAEGRIFDWIVKSDIDLSLVFIEEWSTLDEEGFDFRAEWRDFNEGCIEFNGKCLDLIKIKFDQI